jgi:lipopolysaccharide export system protein LptA
MRTPIVSFAASLLLAAPAVHAERADREKEIVVAADHSASDDIAKVLTLEGNVVVTQGTMRITAAKVTIKEDAQKYKLMVATGAPVTFRQKRDNADEWIDADAQRTEYDERNDKLHLYNHARVKTGGNEVTGEYISYDMKREVTEVAGAPPGTKAPENSRVKVIIIPPKREPENAQPNPAVRLKPDAGKP